jgi:Amt family ammonium transporter
MTGPGLALFYSGLVRKKNVLGVMMQCTFLMGLMTIIWALWGYSLAFGGTGAWLGNADFLLMRGVQATIVDGQPTIPLHPDLPVPMLTHMLFQGMFFIITPALICGAFAERMKFSTMVVFMILWGTLVYCPLCHWVWAGGILAYGSSHAVAGGALDFAGGTVVHINAGMAALAAALVLGKRQGFPQGRISPPHNLPFAVLGAALLWFGWFGFNAGSALAANGSAAMAFVVTHLAASAAGLAWSLLDWYKHGKPTTLGMITGAVAGLVAITPAAGFVTPMPGILIGLGAGVICWCSVTYMKVRFGYDDSLDAFGVHGVGGIWGAIATGLFAVHVDNAAQTWIQVKAVAITMVFSFVVSLGLLKLVDVVLKLRVTEHEERVGLDLTQHKEAAYTVVD